MDTRKLVPVGVAVTALLVLAGVASHGRPLSTGSGAGPSAAFFDYVATTMLLVAIATVFVVAWAISTQKVRAGRPRRGRWNLVSAFAMLAAASLIAWGIANSRFEERLKKAIQQHAQGGRAGPQGRLPHGAPAARRNARFRWDELAIVLVIVGGVGVYLLATRARRPPMRELLRRRQAVSRALEESLDDLRRDPDVRRAIIAAYARMERALALAGVPRAPAEAPFEYLERSLLELEAGAEAARRLTDLFEWAKFSQHEPAESMRDEAVDALEAVRDDLRRPAAEPVTA